MKTLVIRVDGIPRRTLALVGGGVVDGDDGRTLGAELVLVQVPLPADALLLDLVELEPVHAGRDAVRDSRHSARVGDRGGPADASLGGRVEKLSDLAGVAEDFLVEGVAAAVEVDLGSGAGRGQLNALSVIVIVIFRQAHAVVSRYVVLGVNTTKNTAKRLFRIYDDCAS